MPLFDYKCTRCGKTSTRICSYENKRTAVNCDYCSGLAKYVISVGKLNGMDKYGSSK